MKGSEKSMIQLTKLSKALKGCSYVSWIKKNNHDYIVSDYFIIKTNQDIKGAALTKLISLLGNSPVENQGLQVRHGLKTEMTDDEITRWFDLLEKNNAKLIQFTNLIQQTDKDLYSIFKGEDYIFVNKLYVDLVDMYEKNIEILGSTKVSPIYFNKDNEEMMVLPIRVEEDPFYLKGDKK